MNPENSLMRMASSHNIPALAEGDNVETREWLGKQIRLIDAQIDSAPLEDKVKLLIVQRIFERELRDLG